jgi:hypothetical protein
MSDEEVLSLLGDDPADVVICGGSHVPFDRMVGGVRVINVGSVGEAPGNLRNDATKPRPHHAASDPSWSFARHGTSHADATFIELRAGELRVEQLVVPLGRAA